MNAKKLSLGRGFDVLIPKDLDSSIFDGDESRVQKLLITDIIPNLDQPRTNFADAELAELTESIKKHGVLQPLIVVRRGDSYLIVAGERRWRAAKAAKLSYVPAIVRSLKELEQLEIALIENIQRVDLSPLEQAMAIYRLQQQFGLQLEQIAQKLGKAISTVSNITRLLRLPEPAIEALRARKISEGHARAILALVNYPDKQQELLDLIFKNKWTVRQAEQFAVAAKKGAQSDAAVQRTAITSDFTKRLTKKLHLPVTIKHTAKGGKIIIEFKTESDLRKLEDYLK